MLQKVPVSSFETNVYISQEIPTIETFKAVGDSGTFNIDNTYNIRRKPIINITALADVTAIKITNITTGVSVDITNLLALNDVLTVEADAASKANLEIESIYTGMFILKENCINEYSITITPSTSTVDVEFIYDKASTAEEVQYFVEGFSVSEDNTLHQIPGGIIDKKPRGYVLTETTFPLTSFGIKIILL